MSSEISELRESKGVAEEAMQKQSSELAALQNSMTRDSTSQAETICRLECDLAAKEIELSQYKEDLDIKLKEISSLQSKLNLMAGKEEGTSKELREIEDCFLAAESDIKEWRNEVDRNSRELRAISTQLEESKNCNLTQTAKIGELLNEMQRDAYSIQKPF